MRTRSSRPAPVSGGENVNPRHILELYITWIIGTFNQPSGLVDNRFRPTRGGVRDTLKEMLAWEEVDGGWISSGYRIELVRPYHWVLLKDEPAPESVRIEPVPLAEAPTLSLCKREAEQLDAATRVAEVRKRSWGRLVLAILALAFVPTLSPPWDIVFIVAVLVAVSRTVGFLAGTYMARFRYTPGELFYQ